MKLYKSVSDNAKNFINDSRTKKAGFEGALIEGLSNVEVLRANYEAEQELLDTLKGEAPGGEALSREEQLKGMKAGIKAAFKLNHQDLDGLLDKLGRVRFGNYDGALENLLEDYQNDISDEVVGTYVNNTESLLGAGKAAERRKIEKAVDMAAYLNAEGGIVDIQRTAVTKYRHEFKNFIISEDSELTDLTAMAEDAFVKPFSIREHLMRLYEGQKELVTDILGDDQFSMESANDLLASQRMMLSGDPDTGAKGMFDYRYDAYMDVRLHEFDMMRLDQKERRDHWEDQMRAILARGQMEWTDGEKRIKARYEDWLDNVGREYKNKKDAWGDRYLGFLEDKNTWFNVVTKQSTRIGDVSVLENFGDVTQSTIDNAGGDIIITTLEESISDPNKILSEVVDLTLLDTLLANAASLTLGIKFFKPTIFTSLGSDKFTTAELMQNIKDFQGLKNEEYYTHVSKMEYEQMMDRPSRKPGIVVPKSFVKWNKRIYRRWRP